MASVFKSWTFDTDTQNFSLESNTGGGTDTVSWDGNNAALKNLYTNTAAAEDFSVIISISPEESWETWGVPAGSTVTSIELGNIDIATDGTNPGGDVDLAGAILNVYLYDGANLVATLLGNYSLPVIDNSTYFYDTFYGTGSGGQQSVGGSYQSSTTTFTVKLEFLFTTSGGTDSNLSNFIDTIDLNINYDPPAATTKYYLIT